MNTILICDDDKDIVSALDIYLTSEGYETVKAYDGLECLEAVKRQPVDLILLDVMMPGLDGIRTLREMGLESLSLTTIKKPVSLGLSDISGLPPVPEDAGEPVSPEARVLFDGFAEEAIRLFPANVNVAVALALAGPGPERTRMRLIADPQAPGTRHHIVARAGRCMLDMTTVPAPLPENPRSSALAMYSVPALLRQLAEPLRFAG